MFRKSKKDVKLELRIIDKRSMLQQCSVTSNEGIALSPDIYKKHQVPIKCQDTGL